LKSHEIRRHPPFPKGEKAEEIFYRFPQKLSSLWKREDRKDFWDGFFKALKGCKISFPPIFGVTDHVTF
jgi:hypothetical protein